jgi:hypothetical protein
VSSNNKSASAVASLRKNRSSVSMAACYATALRREIPVERIVAVRDENFLPPVE